MGFKLLSDGALDLFKRVIDGDLSVTIPITNEFLVFNLDNGEFYFAGHRCYNIGSPTYDCKIEVTDG